MRLNDFWRTEPVVGRIQRWFSGNDRMVVLGPASSNATPIRLVVVGPKPEVVVAPPPRPLWDERGWTLRHHPSGHVYEGRYRVRGSHSTTAPQEFAGWILEPPRPGVLATYIADPPPELRRHPKGACFQMTQPPWFRVHWTRPAPTVDDAVLYVERILAEALRHGAQ